MKRIWLWLLVGVCVGCGGRPTGQGGFGSAEGVAPTVERVAAIELTPQSGGPNETVIVTGRGFPVDVPVVVRLRAGGAVREVAHGRVSGLGEVTLPLVMPTLWDGLAAESVVIQVEVATADGGHKAFANFELAQAGAFETFRSDSGGYSLSVPQGWTVSEPQQTPLGMLVVLGLPPLTPGNPGNSLILVADRGALPPSSAVALLCGDGCASDTRFRLTEVNGREARRAAVRSGDAPALEWYFFEEGERLVYLTLHDPVTLETLEPLLETLELFEPVAPIAAVATPTWTPTVAPSPTWPPTETPVATPTFIPSPTALLDVNPNEGPVQIVVDFLLDLAREEADGRTFKSVASGLRPAGDTAAVLLPLLGLPADYRSFEARRLSERGVIVEVDFTLVNGTAATRHFEMAREDGAWRIEAIVDPAGDEGSGEGEE